jgi:uncharacterized protein (TIGR00645 family)
LTDRPISAADRQSWAMRAGREDLRYPFIWAGEPRNRSAPRMAEDDQSAPTHSPTPPTPLMRLEHRFEAILFGARWLALPVYVGFAVAVALLVIKFIEEICDAVPHVFETSARDLIVEALRLVDLSFAVNLLIVVMFAGYKNFVSRSELESHDDRPRWLDGIDFSALKLRLIASIVAISAIDLLERYMDIEHQDRQVLVTLGGMQLLFVGVLLALMDRIARADR